MKFSERTGRRANVGQGTARATSALPVAVRIWIETAASRDIAVRSFRCLRCQTDADGGPQSDQPRRTRSEDFKIGLRYVTGEELGDGPAPCDVNRPPTRGRSHLRYLSIHLGKR